MHGNSSLRFLTYSRKIGRHPRALLPLADRWSWLLCPADYVQPTALSHPAGATHENSHPTAVRVPAYLS